MIKIEKIWDKHLELKSEENYEQRYKGKERWFSASGAGNCYKKHLFKILKVAPLKNSPQQNRLFELGNNIHTSGQDALTNILNKKNMLTQKVIHEMCIEIPEINVRGFCDTIVLNSSKIINGKRKKITEILDYKSMKSYSWKMKFGRNPDTNPNGFNEMQISTYAYGLKQMRERGESILIDGKYYEIDTIIMRLLYYKKDDSSIKVLDVPVSYVERALKYWENLSFFINAVTKENIEGEKEIYQPEMAKTGILGCPFYKWECNYCNYIHVCNDNLSTKSCKVKIPKGTKIPFKI